MATTQRRKNTKTKDESKVGRLVMHRVMVTLPEEIHEQLKTLAKAEGVSVSHYIAYAIARQVDAVESDARLGTPVETIDTQKSASTGLPSFDSKQSRNPATNENQATTLGMNSVDVNHL
ncbi:MAG: hypothetical protein AAFV85_17365 [Cyanobacteria bacterium J06634_6]